MTRDEHKELFRHMYGNLPTYKSEPFGNILKDVDDRRLLHVNLESLITMNRGNIHNFLKRAMMFRGLHKGKLVEKIRVYSFLVNNNVYPVSSEMLKHKTCRIDIISEEIIIMHKYIKSKKFIGGYWEETTTRFEYQVWHPMSTYEFFNCANYCYETAIDYACKMYAILHEKQLDPDTIKIYNFLQDESHTNKNRL